MVAGASPEIVHSPSPQPARGIYGFALYISSICLLIAYLVWALVPTPALESIGISYVPSKYWAVAVPLFFPIAVTAFVTLVYAANLVRFHGIFDHVQVVENDFGEREGFEGRPSEHALKELEEKLGGSSVIPFAKPEKSKLPTLRRSPRVRRAD